MAHGPDPLLNLRIRQAAESVHPTRNPNLRSSQVKRMGIAKTSAARSATNQGVKMAPSPSCSFNFGRQNGQDKFPALS